MEITYLTKNKEKQFGWVISDQNSPKLSSLFCRQEEESRWRQMVLECEKRETNHKLLIIFVMN